MTLSNQIVWCLHESCILWFSTISYQSALFSGSFIVWRPTQYKSCTVDKKLEESLKRIKSISLLAKCKNKEIPTIVRSYQQNKRFSSISASLSLLVLISTSLQWHYISLQQLVFVLYFVVLCFFLYILSKWILWKI